MATLRGRPVELKSLTTKQVTGHGTLYVTITYKRKKKPFEVFIQVGKSDPCEKAYSEALARCISIGLRYGIPAIEFVEQLRGLTCEPVSDPARGTFIKSPADALAVVMTDFINGHRNAVPPAGHSPTAEDGP